MIVNEKRIESILDQMKSANILELTPVQILNREHIQNKLNKIKIDFAKLGWYSCPSEWFSKDDDLCMKELGFKLVKKGYSVPEETEFCKLCWERALTLSKEDEEEEYIMQSKEDNILDININDIKDEGDNKERMCSSNIKTNTATPLLSPTPCVVMPIETYNHLYEREKESNEFREIGLSANEIKRILDTIEWKKGDDLDILLSNFAGIVQILNSYSK